MWLTYIYSYIIILLDKKLFSHHWDPSSGSGSGIVFYTYLGVWDRIIPMVKIKELFCPNPVPRLPEPLPEATLLIAAYNEEGDRASKMVNCRQLDYPADKLRLVWSPMKQWQHEWERLKSTRRSPCCTKSRRQGKTAAWNRAIPLREDPYVIFTDANTMLNKGAIKEIIRSATHG